MVVGEPTSTGLQRSLRIFPMNRQHPSSISDSSPEADADLLSELARGDHILGGAGALERWLTTFAREDRRKQGPN